MQISKIEKLKSKVDKLEAKNTLLEAKKYALEVEMFDEIKGFVKKHYFPFIDDSEVLLGDCSYISITLVSSPEHSFFIL